MAKADFLATAHHAFSKLRDTNINIDGIGADKDYNKFWEWFQVLIVI